MNGSRLKSVYSYCHQPFSLFKYDSIKTKSTTSSK